MDLVFCKNRIFDNIPIFFILYFVQRFFASVLELISNYSSGHSTLGPGGRRLRSSVVEVLIFHSFLLDRSWTVQSLFGFWVMVRYHRDKNDRAEPLTLIRMAVNLSLAWFNLILCTMPLYWSLCCPPLHQGASPDKIGD